MRLVNSTMYMKNFENEIEFGRSEGEIEFSLRGGKCLDETF